MSSIWCPNPFEYMTVVANGDVHLCMCPWIRPAGNILQDPPLAIWRGVKAQLMRTQALGGKFTAYCSRCPHQPGPHGFITDRPKIAPMELVPFRIGMLKLDYDRTCRLACGTCRSGRKASNPATVTRIQDALLREDFIRLVDSLYVTGAGDPFDSKALTGLLKSLPRLIDPGLPPKLIIHTHGLTFEKNWGGLGGTRDLVSEVRVSFDDALPNDRMINRDGSWSELRYNLAFIGSLGPEVSLRLYYVVQSNNFMGMVRAVEVARRLKAVSIDFLPLENWGTYSGAGYADRAVHLLSHPRHNELLNVLRDVRRVDTAKLATGTIFQVGGFHPGDTMDP